jgi:ribosomal protein L27
VRIANRPGNGVKSETRRLGRELHFGADVEEGEIAVHQVVRDAGCFVLVKGNRISK